MARRGTGAGRVAGRGRVSLRNPRHDRHPREGWGLPIGVRGRNCEGQNGSARRNHVSPRRRGSRVTTRDARDSGSPPARGYASFAGGCRHPAGSIPACAGIRRWRCASGPRRHLNPRVCRDKALVHRTITPASLPRRRESIDADIADSVETPANAHPVPRRRPGPSRGTSTSYGKAFSTGPRPSPGYGDLREVGRRPDGQRKTPHAAFWSIPSSPSLRYSVDRPIPSRRATSVMRPR